MEVEALALDETPILLTNNEAFALEPVLTTCKHSSYVYSLSLEGQFDRKFSVTPIFNPQLRSFSLCFSLLEINQ